MNLSPKIAHLIEQVDLRQLFRFWVSAQAGSLTRGAELLGLRPATVWGAASTLQQRLGLQLYRTRGRRGLRLTVAGRALVRDLTPLFEGLAPAIAAAARARD